MALQKALIAMSGGVDSSVAAYLMKQNGYACVGTTMLLYCDPSKSQTDIIQDARSVADRMHIPFHVLDMQDPFKKCVMDSFASAYESGLTPNPCVVCNRYLKFGFLMDTALKLDCDKLVTGHYARVCFDPASNRYLLKKARDLPKDQTYFLYTLTQSQLKHISFPLGDLTKEQVRQIAEEQGFLNARKRDSQDICFIPDGDYYSFLRRYTGTQYSEGNYLDLSGKVVGRHKGAVAYTLGQRKGLGLAMGEPVYVCDKDMRANTVTVGPNEALFHRKLLAQDCNWISIDAPTSPIRVAAKARSRMTEQPATVYTEENGQLRVEFDEPQRAITPGQALVFYDGDTVIGGATIAKVL